MFINDDGLQLIGEDERQARIDFYADHSIGWTARPKHGADGFVRKGKFKKVCDHLIYLYFVTLFHRSALAGCFSRLGPLNSDGHTLSELLHVA